MLRYFMFEYRMDLLLRWNSITNSFRRNRTGNYPRSSNPQIFSSIETLIGYCHALQRNSQSGPVFLIAVQNTELY